LLLFRFLGAFAKLRRATISLRHVCPSVRMEHLGSHRPDFHEICYCSIFRKSVQKIKVLLKSDKNYGYFTWKPVHISDHISLSSSWNEKRFERTFYRNSKHIWYSITPFFFSKIAPFMR
jgi:hypothetical protein